MGNVIGDSEAFSTWGRLRGAVIQNVEPLDYSHNEVYEDDDGSFKTEEGNGLLKRGVDGSFVTAHLTVRINSDDFTLEVINFHDDYHAEMVGKEVTNGDSQVYIIDNFAFADPYQELIPMPTSYVIGDIEAFDPIT